MEYLAIISSGDRDRLALLCERLKEVTKNGSITVLSSTAREALESAEVLAEKFKVSLKEDGALLSGAGHPLDVEMAYNVIEEVGSRTNCLLVVGKPDLTITLPQALSKHRQWFLPVKEEVVPRGVAIVVNCKRESSHWLS